MIPKYRTKGFIQLACAFALSILGIYLFIRRDTRNLSDAYLLLLLLLYPACWAMWMVASFTLAKAKGYGNDMTGKIFFFLIIFGFCFPIAWCVFPAVVIFGLKDQTKERRW